MAYPTEHHPPPLADPATYIMYDAIFVPMQCPIFQLRTTSIGFSLVFTHLFAMSDQLLEDPVLIAQPIAVRRDIQRGHAVEETGGQTSQTSVAKTCVFLHLLQLLNVQTQLKANKPIRIRFR